MSYDVDVLERALRNFIDTIEATGGVVTNEDGFVAPAGDHEWVDLGDAYMVACAALGEEPMMAESDEDIDGDIDLYGERDV